MKNFWIYLLVMFAVTYMVRVLPFLIFRKKIENRFVRSFFGIYSLYGFGSYDLSYCFLCNWVSYYSKCRSHCCTNPCLSWKGAF